MKWFPEGRGRVGVVVGLVALAVLAGLLFSARTPDIVVSSFDLNERGVALHSVSVYAVAADTLALAVLDRPSMSLQSRKELARGLVAALTESGDGVKAALPAGTRLLHFFEGEPGDITLDFTAEVERMGEGNILEDRLRLRALLSTLVENLAPVNRVRLLVQGRPLRMWGDHLRLDAVLEVNSWL